MRRSVATVTCIAALAVGGAACSQGTDDSGATTNLEEVGPTIAKLRIEVEALRAEVRELREEVARLTATTDPTSGEAVTTTTAPLR